MVVQSTGEMILQRKKALEYDNWEDHFAKIKGEPKAGGKVKIYWVYRDFEDDGYLFTLPDQEPEENDFFIHIPKPDNSDGIGDAPDVHIHMLELASFERVVKIECI